MLKATIAIGAILYAGVSWAVGSTGCAKEGKFGPGGGLADAPLGMIYKILGPPAGIITGARAEIFTDAPFGHDAGNWSFGIFCAEVASSEYGQMGVGWQFDGAGLGWSGPGKFSAELTTNELNGELVSENQFSWWAAQAQPVTAFFTGEQELSITVYLEISAGYPGDLNGDLIVDLQDLGQLLASFGVDAGGDTDCDGDTDLADLGTLLANFLTCPPTIC